MILWHTLTQSLRFLFRTDTQHWCMLSEDLLTQWTWCMNRGIAVLAIIVLALFAGIFGCSCSGRKKPAPICRWKLCPSHHIDFCCIVGQCKRNVSYSVARQFFTKWSRKDNGILKNNQRRDSVAFAIVTPQPDIPRCEQQWLRHR